MSRSRYIEWSENLLMLMNQDITVPNVANATIAIAITIQSVA